MALLTNGENLEVGGFAGSHCDEIYVRAFEVDGRDTVMSTTHIALWNGNVWHLLRTFEIEIVDIAFSAGGLYCLGTHGELFLFSGSDWTTLSEGISPKVRVSTLRLLASGLYALGPAGRLFRFDHGQGWQAFPVPAPASTVLGLIDVSASEAVLCGTDGLVASGPLARLQQVHLPTNVDFHDAAANDSFVYVCGQAAALFARDGDEWLAIDAEDRDVDFMNFCSFQGKMLLAAQDEIVEVRGLQIVPFADIESERLTATGDCLLSDGMDQVMRWRDGNWSEFPVAFDVPDLGPAIARPKRP